MQYGPEVGPSTQLKEKKQNENNDPDDQIRLKLVKA